MKGSLLRLIKLKKGDRDEMKETLQQIQEILQILGDVTLVLIPIAAALGYKIWKKWRDKWREMKESDREKAQQKLLHFSHEKSMLSMRNLEEICNIYVDKSHADCIMYLQLENGTTADSKLQNMFITCMAESNRYSELPKRMNKIQRLPLQSIISYIEKVNQHGIVEMLSENIDVDTDLKAKNVLFSQNISAWRMKVIHNRDGYVTGYVVFEYLFDSPHSGNLEFEEDENPNSLIDQCQAAIESELLRYNNQIESKRKDLGL